MPVRAGRDTTGTGHSADGPWDGPRALRRQDLGPGKWGPTPRSRPHAPEHAYDIYLVLLDIKSWDREVYQRVTGRPLQPTLDFARHLADLGKDVWVRFVLVPGLTDGEENVAGVASFAASLGNVSRVDVLPFHKLGAAKYEALGERFELTDTPTPTREQVATARAIFAAEGLHAV
ncbi:hypothetical protein [Streptacidiphilus pinicola]|uniref:hypothetical protein n=1 Tax=Streptacidiphilus pinicola TaxID=2219663 RepID=UPI00269133BD